jgi:hypothetical protein
MQSCYICRCRRWEQISLVADGTTKLIRKRMDSAVAAMVLISAKLTGLMLAVVPPVSIGAVSGGSSYSATAQLMTEARPIRSYTVGTSENSQIRLRKLLVTCPRCAASTPSGYCILKPLCQSLDRRGKAQRVQDGHVVQRPSHRESTVL